MGLALGRHSRNSLVLSPAELRSRAQLLWSSHPYLVIAATCFAVIVRIATSRRCVRQEGFVMRPCRQWKGAGTILTIQEKIGHGLNQSWCAESKSDTEL